MHTKHCWRWRDVARLCLQVPCSLHHVHPQVNHVSDAALSVFKKLTPDCLRALKTHCILALTLTAPGSWSSPTGGRAVRRPSWPLPWLSNLCVSLISGIQPEHELLHTDTCPARPEEQMVLEAMGSVSANWRGQGWGQQSLLSVLQWLVRPLWGRESKSL